MSIGRSYLRLIPQINISDEIVYPSVERKEIIQALLELGIDEDFHSLSNEMLKKLYRSHPQYGDNYNVCDDYQSIEFSSILELKKEYYAQYTNALS